MGVKGKVNENTKQQEITTILRYIKADSNALLQRFVSIIKFLSMLKNIYSDRIGRHIEDYLIYSFNLFV